MTQKLTYSQLEQKVTELESTLENYGHREAILKAQKDFLKRILDILPVGVGLSQNRTMLWHNHAMTKMLGYIPEELSGKNACMIYPDDYEYDRVTEALRELLKDDEIIEIETKWVRKDGSIFDCLARFTIFEAHPKSPVILVTAEDITDKKKLRYELNRLGEAIYYTSDIVIITDPNGNITYINPAFERITGYSSDEVLGQNPRILKSGKHDEQFYRDLWNTISNGKTWHGQFINKKKDGTLYNEEATISPVFSPKGEIVAYVGVKRDVTEKIKLQAELHHAQKMESIGMLAGGVAHDFNNILQSIYGYTQLLLLEKPPEDPDMDRLNSIEKATQRAIELARQILTFSRKAESQKRPINLNQEIKLTSKLLKRTIPKMIDMEFHLEKDLGFINADPIQMQQVIMNLCTNARDAMPDGGKIVFETKNVILDDEYCKTHSGAEPGSYVLLSVSDTGHGIDQKTFEHIFEPFYTTKDKGTGLGLAVVYGIVKEHGGIITCNSEPGSGTTFKLYFPTIKTEDEATTYTQEPKALPYGTETILLVDDEPSLLDICTFILTRAGYKVIQASDGSSALEIYRKKKDEISLIILDLIMPGIGGKQCLKKLLETNPEAKVIIVTGYSADESPGELLQLGARGFLQKPYEMNQIAQVVREVLDEK
ncbi:MAG: PAS domain S-box protein [Deltaproteobacteria bacterium]|nr:PAS domain S-box protein [Deltaproteobacteria bacterium]MBW1928330.1 PAS domain S-box protein [Deltaproteobacteria bacterium]